MNGVRVVGVGPALTMAVPGDALVRVFPAVTFWHVGGDLHRLTVQGDAVVDALVPKGSPAYLVGMSAFATDGD
ncbi:hypothetical protein J2X55_002225 [Microbacterium sp. 1154]|nr:hypothetical protein [Microbacterium sp. 1154]